LKNEVLMIVGKVNEKRDAVVSIIVNGQADQRIEVEAVIDTGYNGFLILPATIVQSLNLTYLARTQSMLANGKMEDFDVYAASILWDHQERLIEVDVTGAESLVGTALLDGYDLCIQFQPEGTVTILPLELPYNLSESERQTNV
jgi:clan AA aspartic protease